MLVGVASLPPGDVCDARVKKANLPDATRALSFLFITPFILSLSLYLCLSFLFLACSKMKLVPRELDKLVLHQVGYLAQKRLARGIKLNHTEATALIASQLLEFIRDGTNSVADLMTLGKQMLGRRHVLPDVLETLDEVQIEGTFLDGTYLVTVHDPISSDDGNLTNALYGSFLPTPDNSKFALSPSLKKEEAPGAIIVKQGKIELNAGRERVTIKVTNTGDRPIQASIYK